MRRSHRCVVALCLLAALAGCGAVLDGRATPEPVELGNASVPAGITADDVDASTLAANHDAVLGSTSYTVLVREVVTSNGTVRRNATRVRRVAPGGDRYLFRRVQRTNGFPTSSLAPVLTYWYDGTAVTQRIGTGATARIDRFPTEPPGPLRDPTSHWGVARVLGAFELRPNRTLGDGPVRLTGVRFSDPESAPSPSFVGPPRNASLTAVVDGRGFVRSYRFAYDADASGVSGTVRVVRRVRFVAVGATTVEPPAWADDAR
ncbi:hypothetical protein SAMN05216388_1001369 [Halorientalis persicus]|uniref:Uncharacterized protein n=1 Tax=Halorientalis persicus TaxID=1367881 RepID=A0A1H8DU83_9EURY|nr:hypothetical protein [Halorientalis persicus]SEN10107.1 hypothetical protein SAMN05216388_1001369 [Halorientalis persicus]